jgi:hypothetical protein
MLTIRASMADGRLPVKLSKIPAGQSTAATRSPVNRPGWHPDAGHPFALSAEQARG